MATGFIPTGLAAALRLGLDPDEIHAAVDAAVERPDLPQTLPAMVRGRPVRVRVKRRGLDDVSITSAFDAPLDLLASGTPLGDTIRDRAIPSCVLVVADWGQELSEALPGGWPLDEPASRENIIEWTARSGAVILRSDERGLRIDRAIVPVPAGDRNLEAMRLSARIPATVVVVSKPAALAYRDGTHMLRIVR